MKTLLAIALPLSLLASCRSHSDSKDPSPVVTPIPQPTATPEPELDLVSSATAAGCVKVAKGSLKYEYRFVDKAYQIQATVHGDDSCQNNAMTEIFQSGEFSEKALSDSSGNVLTLVPKDETIRWSGEVPNSFKNCARDAEILGKSVKIGHAKDCHMKQEPTFAKRSISSFTVDLSFVKELEIDLADSAVKTSLNTLVALTGVLKAEESLCSTLITHKLNDGVCEPIEFASASADSLIEFEKGTGLYPKLKKTTVELLAKTEASMPLTISYKFPCSVSLDGVLVKPEAFTFVQIRPFGAGVKSAVVLVPQANDQAVVVNIGGKGPVLLQQFNKILAPGFISLSAYQVDTNCKLTSQVQPNL